MSAPFFQKMVPCKPNCTNCSLSASSWNAGYCSSGVRSTILIAPSLNVHIRVYSPMYSTSVTVRIILSYYFSYTFTTLCFFPEFEKFGSVVVNKVINHLYVF